MGEVVEKTKIGLYIGHNRGKVVVDFGRSVSVIEFEPQDAVAIARLLLKHAQAAPTIALPEALHG